MAAVADRTRALTAERVQGATATRFDQLDVERRRADAEDSLTQARARLPLEDLSLQKSLGLVRRPADAK